MRYCPLPSVVAERTFSINAGLDASIVTPGRIAPEASRTTPVIDACASARSGSRTTKIRRPSVLTHTRIVAPPIGAAQKRVMRLLMLFRLKPDATYGAVQRNPA